MPCCLAIDVGASSGRHILCRVENGRLFLEEIYRFENKQVRKNGRDCWDMENLWSGVLEGLAECHRRGIVPDSVGIDTWGVDYVLLDEAGNPLGDPVAYRDSRTAGLDAVAEAVLPLPDLYARTGIQKQPFNTLYQLLADRRDEPEKLQKADRLLMMPDYLHYRLTGVALSEYTNATTSGLVSAKTRDWDYDLIEKLGLPTRIFRHLTRPGAAVGHLTPAVQKFVGFDAAVVLPATHDTASAFLAVPARDGDAVYLSSGTWSLLGVENEAPLLGDAARLAGFTNEGGAYGNYRFLKNIMGLWMIQSVRRELNGEDYVAGRDGRKAAVKKWSYAELEQAARDYDGPVGLVDAGDPAFLSPESMCAAVRAACRKTGQPVPQNVPAMMATIYKSLAESYRVAVRDLSALTGKTYTSLNIVGGGCKDGYLNALTAKATGLPVLAGPPEGTAIGNLLAQLLAAGVFGSLQEARDAVRVSFSVKEYLP